MSSLTLIINGKIREIPLPPRRSSITLEELLQHMIPDPQRRQYMALAINGKVIPRNQWKSTYLHGGERILLVQPVQGG